MDETPSFEIIIGAHTLPLIVISNTLKERFLLKVIVELYQQSCALDIYFPNFKQFLLSFLYPAFTNWLFFICYLHKFRLRWLRSNSTINISIFLTLESSLHVTIRSLGVGIHKLGWCKLLPKFRSAGILGLLVSIYILQFD